MIVWGVIGHLARCMDGGSVWEAEKQARIDGLIDLGMHWPQDCPPYEVIERAVTRYMLERWLGRLYGWLKDEAARLAEEKRVSEGQ